MQTNTPINTTNITKIAEDGRALRLLRLIQTIRNCPEQSLENILKGFGISRSQFYKDKAALAVLGIVFTYRKGAGFQITEDRLLPLTDLSLSDRIVLLFALEELSASGDGLLAAKAIEIGRKLASGLEQPFRSQLLMCFDTEVTQRAYGVKPEIFAALSDAVSARRRLRMLYRRSAGWTERWRVVDPRHLYMRQRTLYLYARTVDDDPPAWKVFRLSRILAIQPTGTTFAANPDDDAGFLARQANAFGAFIGDDPHSITIRFTGEAIPFIKERLWHKSQQLETQADGSLLFIVTVAEPMEVIRWARQFGENATIIETDCGTGC